MAGEKFRTFSLFIRIWIKKNYGDRFTEQKLDVFILLNLVPLCGELKPMHPGSLMVYEKLTMNEFHAYHHMQKQQTTYVNCMACCATFLPRL
jgi:hypothetical protein